MRRTCVSGNPVMRTMSRRLIRSDSMMRLRSCRCASGSCRDHALPLPCNTGQRAGLVPRFGFQNTRSASSGKPPGFHVASHAACSEAPSTPAGWR